jgi:hypothetical protein
MNDLSSSSSSSAVLSPSPSSLLSAPSLKANNNGIRTLLMNDIQLFHLCPLPLIDIIIAYLTAVRHERLIIFGIGRYASTNHTGNKTKRYEIMSLDINAFIDQTVEMKQQQQRHQRPATAGTSSQQQQEQKWVHHISLPEVANGEKQYRFMLDDIKHRIIFAGTHSFCDLLVRTSNAINR